MEIGDPCRRQGCQGNRSLAVMQRGRGQDATERNGAIGCVDRQLVADPGFLISLGVALDADVTGAWQVLEHLRQGHLRLTLQTAVLGCCSPLRGRPRPRFGLAGGFGVGFSRPLMAVESRDTWPTR